MAARSLGVDTEQVSALQHLEAGPQSSLTCPAPERSIGTWPVPAKNRFCAHPLMPARVK